MNKAKRQIKEIKEENRWADYKLKLVFSFSAGLLFACLFYFGLFLLFGGEINK